MLITALKQTSPEHVTVCLEDGGEIRSTLGVVTELRLFRGRDLDPEALEQLALQSGRARAREKALQYVSQRQMSARELGRKLREKGFDEETADYCVAWITERGLLNEESYAAAIVRHYAAKGYGESRVRQELQRRGLSRELWEDALAAIVRHYAAKGYGAGRIRQELMRRGLERELWEEALAALPEDTAKLDRFIAQRLKDPDDRDAVRKLSAALFRRGFSSEEIRSALSRFETSVEFEG